VLAVLVAQGVRARRVTAQTETLAGRPVSVCSTLLAVGAAMLG
jgi:hypothetical protein